MKKTLNGLSALIRIGALGSLLVGAFSPIGHASGLAEEYQSFIDEPVLEEQPLLRNLVQKIKSQIQEIERNDNAKFLCQEPLQRMTLLLSENEHLIRSGD